MQELNLKLDQPLSYPASFLALAETADLRQVTTERATFIFRVAIISLLAQGIVEIFRAQGITIVAMAKELDDTEIDQQPGELEREILSLLAYWHEEEEAVS